MPVVSLTCVLHWFGRKLSKRFDTPLLSHLYSLLWVESIVQSIIRQQRSQQAYGVLTILHADLFIYYYFQRFAQPISHKEGSCEWDGVAYTGLLLYVCYDWPRGDNAGTTSAELSQMPQIHSHRQWKREDGLLGGLQWGCAGLDLEIKSWLCAGLFPTAFSLWFAVQRLSLYDLNWVSWHVRSQFHPTE